MRRFTAFALLAVCLASSPVFAQSYSTLEERMTGAEFKSAGLDKLSADELAALNAWLQKQSGRTLAALPAAMPAASAVEDRNGFENSEQRRVVSSRLVGEFSGWNGKTTFTLENGQVWQQNASGVLMGISPIINPRVTITPGFMGSWRLKVEGYNSFVSVKRIK